VLFFSVPEKLKAGLPLLVKKADILGRLRDVSFISNSGHQNCLGLRSA
jgi:hypothetical protein